MLQCMLGRQIDPSEDMIFIERVEYTLSLDHENIMEEGLVSIEETRSVKISIKQCKLRERSDGSGPTTSLLSREEYRGEGYDFKSSNGEGETQSETRTIFQSNGKASREDEDSEKED